MSGWAAAAQAGAQLADTGLQVWSAMRANKANESIARKNIEFGREMAQNRYQYTMADMRKAGLNPILAYQQGASGVPASGTANIQPVYQKDGISSAVQKARESALWEREIDKKESEIKNIEQQTTNAKEEEKLKRLDQSNRAADLLLKEQDWNTGKRAETISKITDELLKTESGKRLKQIRDIMDLLNPFVSGATSMQRMTNINRR